MTTCSTSRALSLALRHTRKTPSALGLLTRNVKSHAGDLNRQCTADLPGKLKRMDELPGPSLSATVYWLFVKGYADKSHALQVQNYLIYSYLCFFKNYYYCYNLYCLQYFTGNLWLYD